ncbi:MAG: polyhydroxyalkanoate synthase [Motiliproteus sp.]
MHIANPCIPTPGGAQPQLNAADPFDMFHACQQAQLAWLNQPQALSLKLFELSAGLATLQLQCACQLAGMQSCDLIPAVSYDERFQDPIWEENQFFDHLKEVYLLYTHWLEDAIYTTPELAEPLRLKAGFQTRQVLNAIAPGNFFWTNPAALQRCLETGGSSLLEGMANLLKDAQDGTISMVDETTFRVGENLATTAGAVVYRNELLEVLQYAPTTEQVHQVPIVLVSPWINKYYILDLTPAKSLVKHLCDQGFSVFVTSWKNPGPELRETTLDDYMLKGILQTVEVARQICNGSQVHLTGYCIGGTVVAALMAWLNAADSDAILRGEKPRDAMPVAHWSLLTTLVDFSNPGEIGVFIDEPGIEYLEQRMAETGFLEGQDMASTFRALRSNGLIWHQFIHNYLLGKKAPTFDILYWNTDFTRMPAKMHSFYLRELYLHNRLAQPDGLSLGGRALDLKRITQPLYAVGAEQDHITPWKETFKTTCLVGGPARYVLATSGHIQGIISPPVTPPKRRYWAGDVQAECSPEHWCQGTDKVPGSWWEDWVTWLRPQCGPLQAAPPLGSDQYPVLDDAPGRYVLER